MGFDDEKTLPGTGHGVSLLQVALSQARVEEKLVRLEERLDNYASSQEALGAAKEAALRSAIREAIQDALRPLAGRVDALEREAEKTRTLAKAAMWAAPVLVGMVVKGAELVWKFAIPAMVIAAAAGC